ncbi:MAG: alpha/beta hydrolase [Candidatus Staskawiczbacteria bacterium]|nr:alpha/beta hydrolase [Candidatus Staskawiczbacteria bacterium]
MAKKVYIIHGWSGNPEEGWFPWIKEELEKNGFAVFVPQLPDADVPRINKWVPALSKVVGVPDSETYFVGHSMGCQTIVRYLESLPENVKIGGAVFVAGFFRPITNLEREPDAIDVDREWNKTPIDFAKVKKHINKSVAIFSTNDKYVSLDNAEDYKDKLGSEIIILENRDHFSGSSGITKFPEALLALLKLSN